MNGLSERSDMIKRCWKDTCTSNAYRNYIIHTKTTMHFRYTSDILV